MKLLIENKFLMKEWNYKKNNMLNLKPEELTLGSSKNVWWICSKCKNEWKATPKNRNRGTGCPVCSISKIAKNRIKTLIDKNGSLFDKRPDLVKEWDYEKNFPLTPNDVTCNSNKKVWWKCSKGHEWEARIRNRNVGSNCIFCSGQKAITGENDLKTTNPELLEEWDYEKNGNLLPENFKAKSNISVWWKCALGHSWKTTINHRTNGTGCPHCYNEYGTSFPEQAIVYYLSKITTVKNREKIDGQEIDIYLPNYKIGFEYDGSYYHNELSRKKENKKDEIITKNNIKLYRIKESNCNSLDKNNNIIYCKIDKDYLYIEEILKYIEKILNIKINDIDIIDDKLKIYKQYIKSIKENNFTIKNPELLKEWDYEKNEGLNPENFTSGSNKKFWWKCKNCGSSYMASITHKISGTNCPYCSGKKVNNTNSLKYKFPTLIEFWDYEKNTNISIDKVYFSSRKKAWWVCSKCGKSYEMAICSRIKAKTNLCNECKHDHIGNMNRNNSIKFENSLYYQRPDLLKDWNYEKNLSLTPKDVSIGSGKKVWWKCSKCGNEWEAKIFNRSNGTGCPYCYKNRKTKDDKSN